ncbi:SPI-2 type III secretion system apparatus protein SsaT, partial [Salmonella enterica]|nr:SPI-2 type III secretion system apparatus protein SsaT [Salmonella enterica]EAU3291472.1 SPI-2 type III secretion system apparatus protein SsaT [Salmonella enterica subsp. enterica serovar Uganda]ECG3660534.1 SPI-2 type III secretion system apparatus protein SsaT [Salmonella enterica subsp. enterica serovar Enteritidis]ECU7257950.1 SPI-2 type III secretion system apparatus protein SsaT [Salmonella enterica subsp. enterica serovar Thompson]ECX4427927.1 SPI-2 type III secretion system apparatu
MAQQVNEWLIALAVAFIRPLSLSLLLPLLKSGSLGSAILRNGVLMSLTFPILPIIYQQKIMMHIGKDYSWLGLVTGEVIIGFLIGFCAAVPFWAVDMAGFLLDTLRGATMGTIFNSTIEAETSLFGLLFSQFLCVIFFISGGMEFILNILYESYQYLPPGRTLLFDQQFLKYIQAEWRTLYQLCISFSLPAIICMVLADLALGLLNRSAQQLNVFFFSMPLKSILVLLTLLISFPYALH